MPKVMVFAGRRTGCSLWRVMGDERAGVDAAHISAARV